MLFRDLRWMFEKWQRRCVELDPPLTACLRWDYVTRRSWRGRDSANRSCCLAVRHKASTGAAPLNLAILVRVFGSEVGKEVSAVWVSWSGCK